MSKKSWAENEIELACARERELAKKEGNEGDAEYGIACYQSALKAYKALMEDGHSGCSIGITKGILMRLIDGKPLSPVEDTEDMWSISYEEVDHKSYQHERMPSLFKYVYDDGTVRYSDVDRVRCVDLNNPNDVYSNGFITKIINEMFPITMPYYGNDSYKVFRTDFLFDEKNGDFDTMGVYYAIKSDGTRIEINRYFKEDKHSFVEIDEVEYKERMAVSVSKQLEVRNDEST